MTAVNGGPAYALIPDDFAAMIAGREGAAGTAWLARLPALIESALQEWACRVDGAAASGYVAVVLPVRCADGTAAALKVSFPDREGFAEATALATWGGDGAVRLLTRDRSGFVLLLERVHADRSLLDVGVGEAVSVIGGLLRRLHTVAAPPGVVRLADESVRWLEQLPVAWDRLRPDADRRLLDAALSTLRELGPAGDDTLLHRDLHYGNVLAADREPWLAIDPKGLAGHPAYDVIPVVWNRFDEIADEGNLARGVRRRVDALCEAAGIDREPAYRWTLTRAVEDLLWRMDNDPEPDLPHVAIAQALG